MVLYAASSGFVPLPRRVRSCVRASPAFPAVTESIRRQTFHSRDGITTDRIALSESSGSVPTKIPSFSISSAARLKLPPVISTMRSAARGVSDFPWRLASVRKCSRSSLGLTSNLWTVPFDAVTIFVHAVKLASSLRCFPSSPTSSSATKTRWAVSGKAENLKSFAGSWRLKLRTMTVLFSPRNGDVPAAATHVKGSVPSA